MISYDRNRPLISIHIPKTGGTSFRRNLQAWFGRKLYFHYRDEQTDAKPLVVRLHRRWLGGFRRDLCIHGHFNMQVGVGIETYYPEVTQFITWVRDPVELQISLFHHHMKRLGFAHYMKKGEEIKTTDIDEFLEGSQSPIFRQFPRTVTEQNLFEQVERGFVHIGVLESPTISMRIMAEKLGKIMADLPHENIIRRTDGPSESSIRSFREKSALAYRLYQFACDLNR